MNPVDKLKMPFKDCKNCYNTAIRSIYKSRVLWFLQQPQNLSAIYLNRIYTNEWLGQINQRNYPQSIEIQVNMRLSNPTQMYYGPFTQEFYDFENIVGLIDSLNAISTKVLAST